MKAFQDWLSDWQQRAADEQQAIYALLDGAQDSKLLQHIWTAHPDPQAQSLFLHTPRAELSEQGPWLLHLDDEPALWQELLAQLEQRPLGILIASPAPLAELAQHLRHLLDARLADGGLALMRYYDPQVMVGLQDPACAYWHAHAIRAGEAWAAWLPLEARDCHLPGPAGDAAPLPSAQAEIVIDADMQQTLARASAIPRLLGQLHQHCPEPLAQWTAQDQYQWAAQLDRRLQQHGISDRQDRLFLAVLALEQGEQLWQKPQVHAALERKQSTPDIALSELLLA
ncbi:DUF4123 domain-containing protein [Pseudomonas benzenivorans]|uniref:DUF4123 domain-containing protein n=1 Tax=Pseudomonas benzenivorans TaxID=556533 RepID=A0ABZ0PVX6_9PSED|nr:DUF4123 domain-containing protein [Pseudomonas benzenivorans]WPC05266.1 DUF4123 domain-containing protein [Pseudomonas benzenivorans]